MRIERAGVLGWFSEAEQRQKEVDIQAAEQRTRNVVGTVEMSEGIVRGGKGKGNVTEKALGDGEVTTTRSARSGARTRAESMALLVLSLKNKRTRT